VAHALGRMTHSERERSVCIVGGGPAGLMAGLLLTRAGVDTVVLEKHADFLRDFRGDTVHPSTLELFDQLGLLDFKQARFGRRGMARDKKGLPG